METEQLARADARAGDDRGDFSGVLRVITAKSDTLRKRDDFVTGLN